VRTSLLALLALATLLLSVLAMHSAASSHVMGFALPVATSPADTSLADTALVATPALHHESAAAYAGMAAAVMMAPPLTQSAMLDCALMVMGCVLLLVLAATVWLNRRFTLAHRLLRADKVVQAMLFAVALPIHRPRLALLGVRRV
jgi:hypothetical protein